MSRSFFHALDPRAARIAAAVSLAAMLVWYASVALQSDFRVYAKDELYRSPPYSHGTGDTVLVIWRCALPGPHVAQVAGDLCRSG